MVYIILFITFSNRT